MGFYSDVVVPYCVELTCSAKELVPERERAAAGLHGVVLEIGFGSGINLPHLPRGVTRVLAVDPSERSRRLGKKRIAAAHCPVESVGLDAGAIGAQTASADAALCTFTLCTVPDAGLALSEVKRVLKPGGRFHFLEHGRAPDAGVARWQDRLNGLQQCVCGGCNLNRDIPGLVRAAGFTLESCDTKYLPGAPRTHAFLYAGVATAN